MRSRRILTVSALTKRYLSAPAPWEPKGDFRLNKSETWTFRSLCEHFCLVLLQHVNLALTAGFHSKLKAKLLKPQTFTESPPKITTLAQNLSVGRARGFRLVWKTSAKDSRCRTKAERAGKSEAQPACLSSRPYSVQPCNSIAWTFKPVPELSAFLSVNPCKWWWGSLP